MKSMVVAYDKNRGIGAENDLLWLRKLPTDQRHFRDLTTGNAIIMGRKTFDSIGQPLPNRQNIVISRQTMSIDGVTVVDTMKDAYAAVEPGKEAMIIGGGEIYRLALPDVDRIYGTEVQEIFDKADVFFPALDMTVWREMSREHHDADDHNLYSYDFVTYDRR
jgi:dihydrofolate reductase